MSTKVKEADKPLQTAELALDALPHPVVMLSQDNKIIYANTACETLFKSSLNILKRRSIEFFMPFGSPIIALIDQVRNNNSGFNEYKVDISSPRLGNGRMVDVYASPAIGVEKGVVLQFMLKSVAEKIDRQLTHRNAARTVTGLASMLAHEIKNPLSGIRGAAQLLEMSASEEDRTLTQLIKDETDRIVQLVSRMEVFSDQRPIESDPVNIHIVLERVRKIAQNGFAKNVEITEKYDPSLPMVNGDHDQLVQLFLNLIKNAAEALENIEKPEITLETGFRPGIRLSAPGSNERISLPIELIVRDNGSGISEAIKAYIFDPFITTKTNGSGLGLALVAKIVDDHGGIIECDSSENGTSFKILLPVFKQPDEEEIDNE